MVDDDVATLTRLMLAAGIMILFVAPVSGYWLAGRARGRLARIITTAARLRPSHMEERLPIRGTLDELDQLSLTINHFLDLLGDYLERNREFVANAAHELRSPLAAVQSSVEVTLNTTARSKNTKICSAKSRISAGSCVCWSTSCCCWPKLTLPGFPSKRSPSASI